jgi:NTP pyrophosphatase (non-canonical NTP hydrolase)
MADTTTTVRQLRERVRRFVHERDWERFHNPKDLSMALSIESAELLERFLWREPQPVESLSAQDRRAISDELADVAIYALSLCNVLDLDLSDAVLSKISKNERRFPAETFRGRAP